MDSSALNHLKAGATAKGFRTGTHRLVAPRDTIARIRPHFVTMGITRIANVTGLDVLGIPVIMAVRPNSRSLAVTQGKGLTLEAAKASAVMEAAETYHAERIALPLRMASYDELAKQACVVDIDSLPRRATKRHPPSAPLLWVEGQQWQSKEPIWVPYQTVHTAYTRKLSFGAGDFYSSTTGLASGNHILEAISHGICEVIERDATLLTSLEGAAERHRRRIDLSTIDHPDCRALLESLEVAGVAIGVWETTRDVRVPSFMCTILDRDESIGRGVCAAGGAGCHPTRHVALSRAITEAAQSRLTAIAGSRDDLLRREYEQVRDPDNVAAQRTLLAESGERSFASSPSHDVASFDEDIEWLNDRLAEVGLHQIIVLDLSRAEIGMPVVRVIIPGLESSLAPGDCLPGRRARAILEKRQ